MKYFKDITIALLVQFSLISCDNYLDIVPDNTPSLEQAFHLRSSAEKYLYTCYSYLRPLTDPWSCIWVWGSDESWLHENYTTAPYLLAKDGQNANNPLLNSWGSQSLKGWEAISQCNIFIDNIDNVRDMEQMEKERWKAEVSFLKAFFHFYMLRSYGPIPILDKNIPVSASSEEVRVSRQPIDEVFTYIISLIDETLPYLPDIVMDESAELGRISKTIALTMKAKILVFAASPLFNGNTDYSTFLNEKGESFFNQTYDPLKWTKAVNACLEAIELTESLGYQLYKFQRTATTLNVSDETVTQLNYRGVITERWNPEVIWALSGANVNQPWFAPKGLNTSQNNYTGTNGTISVTLNLAKKFYTVNGVPIEEDKTWDYNGRLTPKEASNNDRFRIKSGETTATFNFDRESRYYGGLGFDRGIWYGNGEWDDTRAYWLQMRQGEWLGVRMVGHHPIAGYFAKKWVNIMNTHTSSNTYNAVAFPRVYLRLTDLYLLYVEALNELNGPTEEIFKYLNKIREIAGIPDVQYAWNTFSNNPNKYTTKEGLREIIHQERTIELLLEGNRFWDIRRWKTAPDELNKPILGWDVYQDSYEGYYREKVLYQNSFTLKDYFWPLSEKDLINNINLIQNPGW